MSIINQIKNPHFSSGDVPVERRPLRRLEICDAQGVEKPAGVLLLEATHWSACGTGDSKYKFWEHPDRPMEQFTFEEALAIARESNRRANVAGENDGRKK